MLASAPRRLARALVAVAVLGLVPGIARAQSADEVKALEARFKKVAAEASPKTVCVKSYIDDTSDKAGYGSGAIISSDGYILTCAHVVDIAKRCEVMLADGSVHKATMLGKCRKQDYALVKIEATGLKSFEIGDSSKLKVGDWVCALGHPGGPYEDLRPSFAAGRVTGLHRKLPVQMMDRFYDDGIQTDVPIVFGNSGGPLVDLDGKLVGLNGAILMINDNAFAVPINEAIADIEGMKKGDQIAGKDPTQQDLAEFQKQVDPKVMQKMFSRVMEKMLGSKGGDNPLAKLFGDGKDNPFSKLFGGEGGQGDLGKMFRRLLNPKGDDQGDEKGDDKDGEDQPGIDLGQLFKGFQKMMQGQGKDGENPFGDLFGKDGQQPDFGKLMKGFQKMFGQGGGDEGDDGDDDEKPQTQSRPAPAPVDHGGYLGVSADQGPDASGRGGVLVGDVLKDGPAAKAGIQKGDVIVGLGGRLTPDIGALQAAVRAQVPGTATTITVDRTRVVDASLLRERVELKVTIAARNGGK